MAIAWIIGTAVAAGGTGLAVRALRGRGGRGGRGGPGEPRCRGCGQRVTAAQAAGAVGPEDRCPECGRRLAGGGITTRQVRRGRLALGLAMVVVGLGGAAAWPDAATRIAHGPTAWLLAVEEPLGTAATRPLLRRELVRRRVAGTLAEHRLDDLAGLLRADLDRIDRDAAAVPLLAEWHPVMDELAATGRLTPADVRRLVDAGTLVSLRPRATPPDGLVVGYEIAAPRTPDVRPSPVPTVPGIPVRIEPVAVRVDGRPVPGSGRRRWAPHQRRGLLPRLSLMEAFGGPALEVPELAPGEHAVELDLEVAVGAERWIRTIWGTVRVPAWPPPGLERLDQRTLRGLMAGGGPTLRTGTLETFRAAGVVDPPEPGTRAARLPGSIRLLAFELAMTADVRELVGLGAGDLVVEVGGRRLVLPLLSATSTGPGWGQVAEGPRLRTVVRLDGPRLEEPVMLPDRLDVLLPLSRLRVRAADPPQPGASPVEGFVDVPGGELRLRDVPVRGLEPDG